MRIDVDKLRSYLAEYCGTAIFNGSTAAFLDLGDIEGMDGYQLCEKAEEMGIDLKEFEVSE